MADWSLTQEDIDRATWEVWNQEVAEQRPELAAAVAEFEAFPDANPRAAEDVTTWFHRDSAKQLACVTRILVADGHVAAFYALISSDMQISATQNLRQMGIFVPLGPPGKFRVGSTHIEVMGRDRRSPHGTGRLALKHAFGLATLAAQVQGNRALTLDPADQPTQDMWLRLGFRQTETQAGTVMRLYAPVFGPIWGPLDRGF